MMDFLSKGMMAGRARLSRIIQVKPYNSSGIDSDGNEDYEGEKENIAAATILNSKPSTHYINNKNINNNTPQKVKSDATRLSRSRSLENLPSDKTGDNGSPDMAVLGRAKSFEKNNNVGLASGSPEMAPVFTSTNSSFKVIKNHLSPNHHKNFNTQQRSPVKRRAKW